jgi:hypothetical protein
MNFTEQEIKEIHSLANEQLKAKIEKANPELFKKEKEWINFGELKGYYINNTSDISVGNGVSAVYNRIIHPTRDEAESTLALSQLRQWRDKANGDKLCDWAYFNDRTQKKFGILRECEEIIIRRVYVTFHDLIFKTRKLAEQFYKDHKSLIKKYYQLN